MGKNTYFYLPVEHRPLPNRLNIVLTTNHLISESPDLIITNYSDIYQTLLKYREKFCEMYKYLKKDFIIFFIGGKIIYEQFIPLCNSVWVTRLKNDYNCDLFIDYDYSNHSSEVYEEDDDLTIIKYTRK
jgi:dihydrofolate reductase